MRKILHTFFVLTLLLISRGANAQITLGTVDAGPYTPGSTLASTFTLNDQTCIQIGNKFTLFLVSPLGAETAIGSYDSFYSTFVNGTIPTNTLPAPGYRLRIKSSAPALTSADSNPFTISIGAAATAQVTTTAINAANPETFGFCENRPNATLSILNQSTATGTVTASITNELLNTVPLTTEPVTQLTFDTNTKTFRPAAAHYTVFVKVVMPNGTVGTKAYFIINNPVNTAFSTSGAGVVCLPLGGFSYGVDTKNIGGIQRNFPGNTYRITWGDDSQSDYTLCELKKNDFITHTYTKSSCGRNANGKNNVFGINIGTRSPFCGEVGQPLSATAKVVTVTENKITGPAIGCANSGITFTNASLLGQNQDDTAVDCIDNTVRFNWFVNGELVLANVPKERQLVHTFPSPGRYLVRLESISSGTCEGEPVTHEICIQAPPKASFTLPSNPLTTCAPGIVKPVNTSVVDVSCNPTVNYRWIVTGGTVAYDAGSSATSKEPTFRFTNPGVYKIRLAVSTVSCQEVITAEQTVIVNTLPTATLSPDESLCSAGRYTFGPNATFTKTTFSGTVVALTDTYTWTVTGPQSATFVTPSGANTQYPTIDFPGFGTYTVTVVHKNNCGTVTKTQKLTFAPVPISRPTAVSDIICHDGIAELRGIVTNGTATRSEWIGAGTFSDVGSLNSTYTPTDAERAAGTAVVTLRLTTGLAGDCATVANTLTLTILPRNIGTNATQSLCSGQTASYQPVSNIAGSTFSWTAANADGNAGPFQASGTGAISQVLMNTHATANAVVVYTIVPRNGDCVGQPFTFTATVTPPPIITATPAQASICTRSLSAITLQSNLTGTTYTWSSIATQGITGNTVQTTPIAATVINDVLVNTGTIAGTVTYTLTPYSASGCPGSPVNVTIRVSPAVTPAEAGADVSICQQSTYQLDGNAPLVGTGNWTVVNGSGITFADSTNPKTSVSGLVAGQVYTFRWTITAPGACAAATDEVAVTVNAPTIAGTTSGAATVCQGVNEGLITLSGHTGTIQGWESSTDGGLNWIAVAGNTSTTISYQHITQTIAYRAIVKNGGCEIRYSNSTLITVTPAQTPAVAGADQVLCNELSTTLTGNSAAPGETGTWTLISGNPNAVITNPTSATTTVTSLVAGSTYIFRWTIRGSSACGPTIDELSVSNLQPLTNVISSSSAEVCNGQTITINGSAPTGGTGTYTYVWESSTDGSLFTVINGETGKDLSMGLTQTLSFRRTVYSGTCVLASNVIRIVAQDPITNNVIASAQEVCFGQQPAALTGSTPAGADGNFNYQWQSSTDGTTWTNIAAAVSTNFIPPALTVTTWYRRAVSTISCNGAFQNISAPLKITVLPNAEAMFTYATDQGCIPFVIDAQNIQATLYPDRNATYTWFANDVQIGTGSTFPGYTLNNNNESVIIKLVTSSSLGCTSATFSHAFSTAQSVTPSFTQSRTTGCGPLIVNFVNTSSSLTTGTFTWDFGNGQTSNLVMPGAVTFQPEPTGKDTTYTVTLTTVNSCGTSFFTSSVYVKAKPIAAFSPSTTSGCSPVRVTFSNTSPGNSNTYYYDFGDGTLLTKTDKSDVEHTYVTNVVRDYVVSMTAENECGSSQQTYTLRISPNTVLAELVVNANEKEGCAPFAVTFYNNSKGANSFVYDFGDGTRQTSRTAPETVQHTFTRSGTFTVTLTASNGCSVTSTTETITVFAQPVVAFSAATREGCADLPVQFSNTSTDAVTYLWDFGDGSTSNEFEPLHTFTGQQEYYTVSLTATNELGCTQTTIMNQYIHIVLPPVAKFNVAPSAVIAIPSYTFRFEDESTNSPVRWEWDFGDGTTSTLPSPSHAYLDTGSYVVTLKVTNDQGCTGTAFKKVTIVGVPGQLFVANSFMPGSPYQELRDFKAKGSGIKSWRMSVFNKWGQSIWETTKLEDGRPTEGWDGTFKGIAQPQGVYFWKIDVEFINGTSWKGMTYDSSAPKKTGTIHLIR